MSNGDDPQRLLLEVYRTSVLLMSQEASLLWHRATLAVSLNVAIGTVVGAVVGQHRAHAGAGWSSVLTEASGAILLIAVGMACISWCMALAVHRGAQYHRYFLARAQEAEHELRVAFGSSHPQVLSSVDRLRDGGVDVGGRHFRFGGVSSMRVVQRACYVVAILWTVLGLIAGVVWICASLPARTFC
jgi:hypothetical protein